MKTLSLGVSWTPGFQCLKIALYNRTPVPIGCKDEIGQTFRDAFFELFLGGFKVF